METFWYRLTQVHLEMVWYGIVEFNVPLDTVYVISERGSTWKMVIKMETALNLRKLKTLKGYIHVPLTSLLAVAIPQARYYSMITARLHSANNSMV